MLEVFVEKTDKLVSLWETRLKPGESTDIAIHDDMAKLVSDFLLWPSIQYYKHPMPGTHLTLYMCRIYNIICVFGGHCISAKHM